MKHLSPYESSVSRGALRDIKGALSAAKITASVLGGHTISLQVSRPEPCLISIKVLERLIVSTYFRLSSVSGTDFPIWHFRLPFTNRRSIKPHICFPFVFHPDISVQVDQRHYRCFRVRDAIPSKAPSIYRRPSR